MEKGIKVNPDKCEMYIWMATLNTNKEVIKLNGMFTTLNIFILKSAQHTIPFYKLLKKEAHFEWNMEYEQELVYLKMNLSTPPILSRPSTRDILFLYLAISDEVISVFFV